MPENTHMDVRTLRYLALVPLHEFTAGLHRPTHPQAPATMCGALPARGFTGFCVRLLEHVGDHSAVTETAVRMDRMAAVRLGRE